MTERTKKTESVPLVRASWAQYCVRKLRDHPDRQRVLDAIGSDVRQILREVGFLGWVPPSVHMTVCDAVLRELGADALEFWRAYFLETFDMPLLRPLTRGALRLYGEDPRGLMRQAPRVYALVTKHCGELSVEVHGDGLVRVHARGLPPAFRQSPALMEALAGTCSACVELAGHGAAFVTRDLGDLGAGHASFDVAWG